MCFLREEAARTELLGHFLQQGRHERGAAAVQQLEQLDAVGRALEDARRRSWRRWVPNGSRSKNNRPGVSSGKLDGLQSIPASTKELVVEVVRWPLKK
jgi:hypothetical protein